MTTAIVMLLVLGALIGGAVLTAVLIEPDAGKPEKLVPIAVLPIPDGAPETKAFLELLAGQLAWIDASLLQSVILVYRCPEAQGLCLEMAKQYDFFSCLSVEETKNMIEGYFNKGN